MPAVPAAKWESLARGFVTGGCPVLGATVGATFLDGAAERRIRTAAVAALGPTARPEPTETVEATPTPAPEPAPEVATKPADPTYSCATLCTMHMVELCNNDRALWTQNGARWENTRCGDARSEEFLAACYRMQWLSGTYEQSCMQPCETGDDGRADSFRDAAPIRLHPLGELAPVPRMSRRLRRPRHPGRAAHRRLALRPDPRRSLGVGGGVD
jgi:hypothetical protein